jgi:tetratricopeptide (TPR) repeat protein
MHDPGVSALRPLAGVRDAVATLRIRGGDVEVERTAYLRVSAAIEASLRRMLRDLPDVPIDTRLRALAGDEMALDEVVATLRRQDRLTRETAAGVNELASARRRVAAGGEAAGRDLELAVSLVASLEREAYQPVPAGRSAAGAARIEAAERIGQSSAPGRERTSRREALVPVWIWATAGIAVLGLLLLGVFVGRDARGPALNEGIALFRSGDFERAATEFERYVSARPEDPTGRLYLARVYRRLDRRERAAEEIRLGLEQAPEDAAFHRELGLLLLDAGQPDAASDRFRTAVTLAPESVEGWLGLIRALRESGQPQAAENIIARAPPEVRALVRPGP